jgi:hypothetical protein
MPHLISNLVEKAYTPFTAKLAPRHLWSKPQLGRKPQKVSRFGADPTVKATWRFIRRWVAQNHKLYYTYVVLCKKREALLTKPPLTNYIYLHFMGFWGNNIIIPNSFYFALIITDCAL